MEIRSHFLNVPVMLCHMVLREKFFRPFQVWIYLKSRCRGQVKLNPEIRRQIANDLNVNERTVRNSLRTLLDRNWVGVNSKSGIYFIRGFKVVMRQENVKGRSGAWIGIKKELNDIKIFKGFIVGASLGYLANVQKWKVICKLKSERLTGSSKQGFRNRIPSYFPISCNALERIFGFCFKSGANYKKLAFEYGFVDVKKQMIKIAVREESRSDFNKASGKGISSLYVSSYKKAYPEIAHKVRIKSGYLYLEESDLIKPLMEFKRKHSSFNKLSS